jgi:hypothetical protein
LKRKFLAALAATTPLMLAYAGAASADNTASDTVGVVQVGSTTASPSVGTGSATASAPVAVGGDGGNNATGSTGAVQVGGGNSANGSTGSMQVGESSVAAAASGQSGGEAARVAASLGTSDGNSANGSIGAIQVGGVRGTTSTGTSGPAGAQSLTVPLGVGGDGGNSAGGSTGTIQLGGGTGGGSTSTTGLTSTAFGEYAVRSLAAAFPSLSFPTAATERPSRATGQGAGLSPSSASRQDRLAAQPGSGRSRLAGQATVAPTSRPVARALRQVVALGSLPFTGRSLLFWGALGLGVGLLGLGVRARAAA